MPFYEFCQNNSGGSFTGPAIRVFVEADSPAEADAIAEYHGIYFDPWYERDCDCCGTRWSPASDCDATDKVPEVSKWDKAWSTTEGVPAHLVIGKN